MNFQKVLTQSKAVARFASLQGLSDDQVLELYFESFCSYIEMFRERLKYAKNLNRVMAAYRPIESFCTKTARQVVKAMFCSHHMHEWFAYRFIEAVDNQLMNKHTSKGELHLALTFTKIIPVKESMEEILNETQNLRKQKARIKRTGERKTRAKAEA